MKKTYIAHDYAQVCKMTEGVVLPALKAWFASGGKPLAIKVSPLTRSLDQNARLHALITEIAKTRPWAGEMRDVEVWKRLLVAAWLRARGESVMMLPAIDGHGLEIVYAPTSQMTIGEVADLMTFIEAWQALGE